MGRARGLDAQRTAQWSGASQSLEIFLQCEPQKNLKPVIAANADPATGYLTMSGGKLSIVGGTSALAPLWASLVSRINAIIGKRVGNFNALLYSTIGPQGTLRDITSGNNDTDGLLDGQYPAGPGWDACSGWGTPDGGKLLSALQ